MKLPLSWLRDFIEIQLPLPDLAHLLTMAGLEVEEVRVVGLPLPAQDASGQRQEIKITGIAWDPQTLVVGEITEVLPHPNADRLVLCKLQDGEREHIVLTGAPNLYPYKGQGPLAQPLKVAYAKEGAQVYDGHQPGQVLMTLKRAKIRGVESYSMVCSEKELGISDEHEGILFLDAGAPTGMPLADYMGDAVLDITLTPNISRDANVLGIARELSALTGQPLKQPSYALDAAGPAIQGRASIRILDAELNPRFVLGLVENVEVKPSPYEIQRRLRLAGMRPINNIVDATNYAMLEVGQPLHAFDYDVLVERAAGSPPVIITRPASQGEQLTTLDGVERRLQPHTVLVTDSRGPLSIAGVMGGKESEVSSSTRNVLLEGAAWNFINVRRTVREQRLSSEAAYRFSRGVHPAMAERGVRRGLQLLQQWTGGTVAAGLIDEYPLPPQAPQVAITAAEVSRWLGIDLSQEEIIRILTALEFEVETQGVRIIATAPDHRLDIGEGVIGVADLMEEIARIYGYHHIPETRLADALPPQRSNARLDKEERIRDLLVNVGLSEVITYRMTSAERENKLLPNPAAGLTDNDYLRVHNPIVSDRNVLRRRLLSGVMEVVERNARLFERQAYFEVGSVFLPVPGERLPFEPARLAIVLTGARSQADWRAADADAMDFYDLKGLLQSFLGNLHVGEVSYQPAEDESYHPGKSASLSVNGLEIGIFGELHPQVRQNFDLPAGNNAILAAELDLESLLSLMPNSFAVEPVPAFPAVLEDLAVVVEEALPAGRVEEVIRKAGGENLAQVRLFDVFRGEQVGAGKKSLAYALAYLAPDRTLSDKEAAQIRQRIIKALEQQLQAYLR